MALPHTFRYSIYAVGFLFNIHLVLPVYINSTYLSTLFGAKYVGFVYALSAIVTIFGIIGAEKTMRKWGAYRTTLALFALELIALFSLSFIPLSLVVLIAFIFHFSLSAIIPFQLDVYLEHSSNDEETGNIRGVFLTILNVAWLIAPVLSGIILGNGENFTQVYFWALIALIPVYTLSIWSFRKYKDAKYKLYSLKGSIASLMQRKDIRNITLANFLLKLFFSWMVIYTPLYMYGYLGFDFNTIGLIMTLILTAYVFIELPLGILADKILGEKEILITGFVIIALSTSALSFLTTSSWIAWTLLLFITRIGAAAVEVMTDTYFFKKTTPEDAHLLSLYRMTYPASYIVAPILAALYLIFFEFSFIFLAIGLVMLLGIFPSMKIQDTK